MQELLEQVSALYQKQRQAARLSGENFNVFRILGLEAREVRTHSAFLGELLNPFGSHGQGDTFLQLFLPLVHMQNVDCSRAQLLVERHIGHIDANYEQGGRIDLYLEAAGNYLFIENKIYAVDQKNQLLRYHHHRSTARLVYLTLGGEAPTEWSTGGKLTADQYQCLSYRHDIRGWLEKCQLATDIPVLRETIMQYLKLILDLTGSAPDNDMKHEVRDILLQSPSNFEAAAYLAGFFPELKQELIDELREELQTQWREVFAPDATILPGYVIYFEVAEDNKKKYFGFRAHKDDTPAHVNSTEALAPALALVTQLNPPLKKEWDWLGWRYLDGYATPFSQLPPAVLLALRNDATQRQQMITAIIEEATPFYQQFKQRADAIISATL
jgi:hypothetical protein